MDTSSSRSPRGARGNQDDDVVPEPEIQPPSEVGSPHSLGPTLRRARNLSRMSLRAVETATNKQVTNGYLSQIERGVVTQPSPNALWHLANVYGIDYGDLLVRAGHRIPRDQAPADGQAVEGLPMSALADLTAEERAELAEYIQFLRFRRNAGDGRETER